MKGRKCNHRSYHAGKEFYKEYDLAPLIGRYEEIEEIARILLRRTKNDPILVGEYGVGKTTIVEGFAKTIVQGKVPEEFADKQIFSLDLTKLIAGTNFRERFKKIASEIETLGNVILFIDDIHTVIDAVRGMDVSDILKTILAQDGIQCIAARGQIFYTWLDFPSFWKTSSIVLLMSFPMTLLERKLKMVF